MFYNKIFAFIIAFSSLPFFSEAMEQQNTRLRQQRHNSMGSPLLRRCESGKGERISPFRKRNSLARKNRPISWTNPKETPYHLDLYPDSLRQLQFPSIISTIANQSVYVSLNFIANPQTPQDKWTAFSIVKFLEKFLSFSISRLSSSGPTIMALGICELDLNDTDIATILDSCNGALKSSLLFLVLKNNGITNLSGAHIDQCQSLTHLDVEGNLGLNDTGITSIEKLSKSLLSLNVSLTGLTKVDSAKINTCTNLEQLFVAGNLLTNEGLYPIASLSKTLRVLDASAANAAKNIRGVGRDPRFDNDIPRLDDLTKSGIDQLTNLEKLDLAGNKFDTNGIKTFCKLSKWLNVNLTGNNIDLQQLNNREICNISIKVEVPVLE